MMRIAVITLILLSFTGCASFFGSQSGDSSSTVENAVPEEDTASEEISFDQLFELLGNDKKIQSLEYKIYEPGFEDFGIYFLYSYDNADKIASLSGSLNNEMEYSTAYFYEEGEFSTVREDYYDPYADMTYSSTFDFDGTANEITSVDYFDSQEMFSYVSGYYNESFSGYSDVQQYNFSSGNCAAFLYTYYSPDSLYKLGLAVQGFGIAPQTDVVINITGIEKDSSRKIVTVRYTIGADKYAQIISLNGVGKIQSYYILDSQGTVVQDAMYYYGMDNEISQIVSRTPSNGQLMHRRFYWGHDKANVKSLWL